MARAFDVTHSFYSVTTDDEIGQSAKVGSDYFNRAYGIRYITLRHNREKSETC